VKILIDPLYSTVPSVCSAMYCAWQIIAEISNRHEDAFFYVVVPKRQFEDPEERAWLEAQPYRERVTFLPLEIDVFNRMLELFRVPEQLMNWLNLNDPSYWDVDVVVTARIPQLLNYRVNGPRPTIFEKFSLRGLIGLDDVPLFSVRKNLSWAMQGLTDLPILGLYYAANAVVLQDFWTRDRVIKIAKEKLSPSQVRELSGSIHESVSARLTPLQLREAKPLAKDEELNVVFTGRITSTKNFKGVVDLFRKHFAYGIGKEHVRFRVSTHSRTTMHGVGETDFLLFERNGRDEFYRFLRERAHVAVNLSHVEDFSMSTYEPLLHGVPVVVSAYPWSDFLGPEYPFRVRSLVESYALIKDFIRHYDEMYARFVDWHEKHWRRIVEEPRNRSTAEVVCSEVERFLALREQKVAAPYGGTYRDLAEELAAGSEDRLDLQKILVERGVWKLGEKIPPSRRPSLATFKAIVNSLGFRDAKEVGHVVRA